MQIKFTIPGPVRGKGRHKHRYVPGKASRPGFVMTYTDSQTVSYENLVKVAAAEAMAGRPPMDGPIAVLVKARVMPPASAPKKRRQEMLDGKRYPTTKPDLDNVLKALLDGLNKVAFTDDARVVGISMWKTYGESPGLEVKVSEVLDDPS